GIVLMGYFAEAFVVQCAKVVLPREPSGRALIWGSLAGLGGIAVVLTLWIVVMNGSLDPRVLAGETATVITPLAAVVGSGTAALGTLLVLFLPGLATAALYGRRLQRRPGVAARALRARPRAAAQGTARLPPPRQARVQPARRTLLPRPRRRQAALSAEPPDGPVLASGGGDGVGAMGRRARAPAVSRMALAPRRAGPRHPHRLQPERQPAGDVAAGGDVREHLGRRNALGPDGGTAGRTHAALVGPRFE